MRLFSKPRKPALRGAVVLAAVALTAAACSSSGGGGSGGSAGHTASTPQHGGSLTVLEWTGFAGDWPAGLDPATNINGAADQSEMDAIFGQLFELGQGGKMIPDLATGYKFSNGGKTITLTLRHGVKFSDGTPFNAAAVVWNFKRDMKSNCTCKPRWPVSSITSSGPYTVQVNLQTPDGAFIDQIQDSTVDWIASPTAEQKMGEKKFAAKPVGAGPFTVVSDTYSSQLVVKRNPHYWQKGRPYLDKLTFKSVSGDESAYETMLAGAAQVYEGLSTPSLLKQVKQHFTVIRQPGTSPYDLQLNTKKPPFNNKQARLAIYYATNFTPILQHVFDNLYKPTQSFTGPGGICYQPNVPGYPGYNPAKAKQIVQKLGGMNIQLGTIQNVVAEDTTQALQTEWAKVGIKATIHNYPLASLIQQFTSNKWQAMIQTAGAYDPAAGVGVGFRFMSNSPFSGVHDPHLDTLLNKAVGAVNQNTRCSYYHQAADYIAQQAYGPFYFTPTPSNVVAKKVHGPGLTTPLPSVAVAPAVLWEDVWTSG